MLGGSLLTAQDNLWVNSSQLLDFNAPAGGATVCGLPLGHDYNGAPAQYAQNAQYDEHGKLLCFGYGRCRAPLTGGFDRPQPRMVAVAAVDAPTPAALSIHPNPASSWVAFNYNLQALPDHAELIVRDAAGREVYRAMLQASEQQHLWDTREVASGTYTAVLLNGGRELRAEKLIVKQ